MIVSPLTLVLLVGAVCFAVLDSVPLVAVSIVGALVIEALGLWASRPTAEGEPPVLDASI